MQDIVVLTPTLKALNPRQRAFVFALELIGGKPGSRAAAMAGYEGTVDSLAATASRLKTDPKVQAAILELARVQLQSDALLATCRLHEILESPNTSVMFQLRAIEMVFNRVGLHATQEHIVNHNIEVTEKEKVKEIVTMANKLGIDPQKLLGNYNIPVDAEFSEVTTDIDMCGLEDL